MDRRQITNYVNLAALIGYHDVIKHLDDYPLEGK